MKKSLVIFLILIVINILAIPTLSNITRNNSKIEQLISDIPNNTVYINVSDKFENSKDEKHFINQLSDLDIIKDIKTVTLHNAEYLTYIGKASIGENNTLTNTIEMPTIYLENAEDQKLPIISGHNLTADKQIVISSSFANEVTNNQPDTLLNTYINSLEVVGIYEDPNPVAIYDSYYAPFYYAPSPNNYYSTSNIAFTIDSSIGENAIDNWYISDGTHEYITTNQLLQLTFLDDELDSNIEDLYSTIGDNDIYTVSNHGISGYAPNQDYYLTSKQYKQSLINGLVFLDIITIVSLIALNRKESNA